MRIKRFLAALTLCWVAVPAAHSQGSQYQIALPHIAFGGLPNAPGGQWETKIVVTNVSNSAQNLAINYYDTNGNPLAFTVNGGAPAPTSVVIPVNGQQEIVPDFQGSTTTVGWAGLNYNALALKIQGIFLWQNNGNSTQAVAPIVSLTQPCILGFPNTAPLTMPFDQTGGASFGSAFAFANTMPTPVTMTLSFFDQTGASIGQPYTPPAIPGYGHIQIILNVPGQLPPQLASAIANTKGSMQITGAGVVPLGFKFYGNIFTTWLP